MEGGRGRGGLELVIVDDELDLGRRSGEAGSVVSEQGVGAVGGGRWTKVNAPPSSFVTTALGLSTSGSEAR